MSTSLSSITSIVQCVSSILFKVKTLHHQTTIIFLIGQILLKCCIQKHLSYKLGKHLPSETTTKETLARQQAGLATSFEAAVTLGLSSPKAV